LNLRSIAFVSFHSELVGGWLIYYIVYLLSYHSATIPQWVTRDLIIPDFAAPPGELYLASFDSVRAFGRRCESQLKRLDTLVENGGFIPGKWAATKDGWEAG
jgi:hypothetical protein